MSHLQSLAEQQLVEAIGWTLLHCLWQASLLAVIVAAVLYGLRERNARYRYLAACSGLLAVVFMVTYTLYLHWPADAQNTTDNAAVGEAVVTAPSDQVNDLSLDATAPSGIAQVGSGQDTFAVVLTVVVIAWLIGVVIFGLRLAWHWVVAERWRRSGVKAADDHWQETVIRFATRICLWRPVRILESSLVTVPMVVGWLRPVILFPASALMQLPPDQIEALIAHEVAHIRRHDYLINVLQSIAEAVLFFHPAVWWISHQIKREREFCCDDIAVSVVSGRVRMARALEAIETSRQNRTQLAMAAAGVLLPRIRRLTRRPSAVRVDLGALFYVAVGCALVGAATAVDSRSFRSRCTCLDRPDRRRAR